MRTTLLKEHRRVHGHVSVSSILDPQLTQWIYRVRENQDLLTPGQVHQLEELGFDFNRDETKWKRHIQDLLTFKKAHGHCEVLWKHKDNPNLANWLRGIRGSKRTRKMSAVRMEELDKIGLRHGRDPSTGLVFDSRKKISQQTQKEGSSPHRTMGGHIHAPQDFQALDNGHGDDSLDSDNSEDGFVSFGVSDGENMAPAVDRKKCLEEDSTKTEQPRKEVPSQVRMVNLFNATPKFKAQDVQHPEHGRKRSRINQDRFKMRTALLKEHRRVHGHVSVSRKLDPQLAQWTYRVVCENQDLLTPGQVHQLEELDFDFNPDETKWKRHIQDLLTFKKAHGHCEVPWKYKDSR